MDIMLRTPFLAARCLEFVSPEEYSFGSVGRCFVSLSQYMLQDMRRESSLHERCVFVDVTSSQQLTLAIGLSCSFASQVLPQLIC